MSKTILKSKFVRYILPSFVICLLLLYMGRDTLLEGLGSLLKVDNATRGADVLVILSGDPFTRVPKAAQLFKEGYADRILTIDREQDQQRGVLGEMGYKLPDPSLLPIELLAKEGVPEGNIIRISHARAESTFDEARILKEFCLEHSFKRFIIVTTAYHTGRAWWIFRKIFKGSNIRIEAAAADRADFDETNWWKKEEGFLAYFNEYLKWIYYLANY